MNDGTGKKQRFYANLRAEMSRRGFTIAETANLVWISRSGFFRRLKGTTNFTVDEAKRLAELFGTDIDYIMEYTEI